MGYDRNTIGIGYLLIILVSADISVFVSADMKNGFINDHRYRPDMEKSVSVIP